MSDQATPPRPSPGFWMACLLFLAVYGLLTPLGVGLLLRWDLYPLAVLFVAVMALLIIPVLHKYPLKGKGVLGLVVGMLISATIFVTWLFYALADALRQMPR
ncbi:hypothetical protein [Dyella silvatica]|uniref:hypothetical protein n=1 Tax=Dyella silvatica TaxID=2992128 RepID=UPI00225B45B4|nr:hypothetical protein [Dyella silvatica]